MLKKKILVTSTNPTKINAVKKIIDGPNVQVCGIDTYSGIVDGQPFGMEGTLQGALHRISSLDANIKKEYDQIVSIENGVITLNTNDKAYNLDFPIVVFVDLASELQTIQFGCSRTIPLEHLRKLKSFGKTEEERGKWVEDYYKGINHSQSREFIIACALSNAVEEMACLLTKK